MFNPGNVHLNNLNAPVLNVLIGSCSGQVNGTE